MNIEIRELMNDNEMLSHIFLDCIPHNDLISIRDKYNSQGKDWKTESVKIPVTLKIGGKSVNPKKFFDSWQKQMSELISKKAQKLVADNMGSEKMMNLQNQLYEMEQVLKSWENEINWEVKNPFINDEEQ